MKLLLLPFSWLYGCGTWIRNVFYDKGIFTSKLFPFPVISVGNLTTGGTGKTPHTEYLIRLLKGDFRVATLSRGYGRATKGFMIVSNSSYSNLIGDEPMQYHTKFKDIIVSVGEDRVSAIENLMHTEVRPEVILLDDAFQHRAVKPGLSVLLVEYDSLFKDEYVLPAGNLREWKSGMKRANIIVVSKSPEILVSLERKRATESLTILPEQLLVFSYYKYGEFVRVTQKHQSMMFVGAKYYFEKRFTILLVTGIASPAGITEYLRRQTDKLETIRFADHHAYTVDDISKIKDVFDNIANTNKIIVTTEKDAMRFQNPELEEVIAHLPIFYLPIEVAFHHGDQEKFNQHVLNYVRQNKTHLHIHH